MNKKFKIKTLPGQKKNLKSKILGFTLIELLVVIGILVATGTIMLSILFVTLRTSKKSDLLVTMKQNGNSALSQIVKSIRYAKSLDSPTSCVPQITNLTSIAITSYLDNAQTTFSCVAGPPSTIASNGASLLDTNSVAVSSCSFTCSQPTLNDSPTINFIFTLSSKNATSLVESTGTIPFQTSVTMRNFNN